MELPWRALLLLSAALAAMGGPPPAAPLGPAAAAAAARRVACSMRLRGGRLRGGRPTCVCSLRLRGGRRGRNSVVVGKKAQQKGQPWTHFTGGDSFGAVEPTRTWDDSAQRSPQRPARGALKSARGQPPGELQRLRTGEPARRPRGKGHAGDRFGRGGGRAKHHLLAGICAVIQREGACRVLEMGCSSSPGCSQLLQRVNIHCPNVTHYVGVDVQVDLLSATLEHLSRAYPVQATVCPKPR